MHHVTVRRDLSAEVLAEILELIEDTTRIEGHPPVGEHKYAHLKVGATDWVGLMAYEDRRLVGYAHLRWNAAGAQPRVAVEIVVHPHHRDEGVQQALLTETREVLARAGGGTMYLWVHRVEDARDTLAHRMGFAIQRELAFMRRSLATPPAPLGPPEGITIRRYRPGPDDGALLEVNNAAFAGHPENGGWDRAELTRRRSRDWFDPDGVLLAWRDERLLGFHWTKWHAHEGAHPPHDPEGEVYILAVHPDAQGLGLGRVLLRAGLAHLHDRGCGTAILYVDCANEAAVDLYASEGFEMAYREVCYEDHLEAAGQRSSGDLLRPA